MKVFAAAIIYFVALFSLNSTANSQPPFWTQIPLPAVYHQIGPYFLNENIGFIFDVSPLRVQSNLRRTTNGGASWQTLRFFDDANILINQLYFTDLNRGYAATSAGVYETTDNGNSWKSIFPNNLSFNSVYAFGNTVFAFAFSMINLNSENWGPLIATHDDGATWDTIIQSTIYTVAVRFPFQMKPMTPYIFGNKDGTLFAENILNQNNMEFVFSTDNGKNWSTTTMDILNQTYTMGLFSFPHCNDLLRTFISFKQNPNSDVYQIASSSDFGAHWNNLYHPIEIGAWVSGNNCVQYVSNATPVLGLYRSSDRGIDWSSVSGPDFTELDDEDFHNLSIVGGGAVVYAGDYVQFANNGNLWKTTTGGDGTLSSAQFVSQITMAHSLSSGPGDTLNLKECDTGFVTIPFQNISCNFAHLEGITIDGLDSSEFSTLLKHHLFCDNIPDTLILTVIGSSVGIRNITVHPHFINDEYETIDTSFTFTLATTSASGTSIYLRTSAISGRAFDTLDIPLYINNASSNPVKLGMDSINLNYILNTDLITPYIFTPSPIGIKAGPVTVTRTNAAFTLYFPSGFAFTGETVLGKLRCEVYVSDSLESDISFAGDSHSSPCQSIQSNSLIHFSLAAQCGDSSLSKMLKYGAAYSITSIIPNPARNSVNVVLKNNGLRLQYEIFDALGNQRRSGWIGGNSFQIDLSDLSTGSYYLRISGDTGIPVTRKIVVAK